MMYEESNLGYGSTATAEQLTAITTEVAAVIVWVRAKGITGDVYFMAVDEAGSAVIAAELAEWAAIQAGGGKVWATGRHTNMVTAGAIVLSPASASLDMLDDSEETDWTTHATAWHAAGKKYCQYSNPHAGEEDPLDYRLYAGLQLYQAGADGNIEWHYMGHYGFCWEEKSYLEGVADVYNWMMAYPTANGVIDTIQMEGWREGTTDRRYVKTLENAIASPKAGTTTTAAQAYLDNLKTLTLTEQNLDTIRGDVIDFILYLTAGEIPADPDDPDDPAPSPGGVTSMATTTYETLRTNFGYETDGVKAFTTTSAGDTTSLISAGLNAWDGANDDYYNKQWFALTSGTYDGSTRFITDYATSTGDCTFVPALAGAPGSAVTGEIYTYEPNKILKAFQSAVDLCYPSTNRKGLYKNVITYDTIVGNWLWNSHFEEWATTTTPDHHTLSGTATVSAESTIIRGPYGTYAMKMTGGGAADYMYQSQAEVRELLGLAGQNITFHCYVYCATASKGRIGVYTKGRTTAATTTYSSYQAGSSEYEHLEVDVSIPSDLTQIKFEYCSGGDTVYFENAWTSGTKEPYLYHISKTITHKPIQIFFQENDSSASGETGAEVAAGGENWSPMPAGAWDIMYNGSDRLLILHALHRGSSVAYATIQERKLKIHAMEPLSSPTTDASTIEVAGEQARALVAVAAHQLFLALATSSSASDDQIQNFKSKVSYWQAEADRRLQLYGMPVPYNRVNVLSA
jgi:hypothetical protein